MSAHTRQLGKQAMDALEKAVLSAMVDAENGECSDSGKCNGIDQHGPACITNVSGIYTGKPLNHVIVAGTFHYLQSKGFLEKPRGYRLTALGRKSLDGES